MAVVAGATATEAVPPSNGVDPFAERWPVTLRCEGTVRGGGIRLLDDCATGVPGLYAGT